MAIRIVEVNNFFFFWAVNHLKLKGQHGLLKVSLIVQRHNELSFSPYFSEDGGNVISDFIHKSECFLKTNSFDAFEIITTT
jgi:hypothetical protein